MNRIPWTLALVVAPAIATSGWAAPDHLACYRVRDTAAKATYTATVNGLTVQPGCRIRVPASITCQPASKDDVVPTPPGSGGVGRPNGFTCYKVRCPTAAFSPISVQDQFGTRSLTPTRTSLLCAPNAGPTDGGFPATGQTQCWDPPGTTIPCAGTGQDGDLRTGAALAYVDNGDGTITDLNTGLMWEKGSQDGTIHDVNATNDWAHTFAKAFLLNAMNFAGHNDWRVPNIRELQSIVDYQNQSPAVAPAFNNSCGPGCTVLTCSCTAVGPYWSSTAAVTFTDQAWLVDFTDGSIFDDVKQFGPFPVVFEDTRCVRGGS